jgi:hypothetical protein
MQNQPSQFLHTSVLIVSLIGSGSGVSQIQRFVGLLPDFTFIQR